MDWSFDVLTTFGEGTVVCGGAVISTNVKVGDHVHINPSAVIGHDTTIDAFVSINPNATVSGDVHLQEACLIGAGAVILQGLTVGKMRSSVQGQLSQRTSPKVLLSWGYLRDEGDIARRKSKDHSFRRHY